ncbi:MAG: shikimate dehydrogenase [Cyanobacteriota bacterium]
MSKKNYVILGYPLKHTISPIIHNTAFQYYNIDCEYGIFSIEPNEFSKIEIDFFRKSEFQGGNVTIPYKEKIINYLDKISDVAGKIGAVNTFYKKNELLLGDNTDYHGFFKSINKYNRFLENKTVVILGTGGSSKAVFHAILNFNPKKIIMVSRDKYNSENFVINKKQYVNLDISEILAFSYEDLEKFNLEEVDTLINTTPVGMYENILPVKNIVLSMMKKNAFVYDLIYNPEKTKLLEVAENYGMTTMNGKEMLIYQAEKAFEIWTGKLFPDELIKKFLDIKIN